MNHQRKKSTNSHLPDRESSRIRWNSYLPPNRSSQRVISLNRANSAPVDALDMPAVSGIHFRALEWKLGDCGRHSQVHEG